MSPLPRVVVTGVGLVTPLGVGVTSTWRRLLDAECGVVSLEGEDEFRRLPCQLAARVPRHQDTEAVVSEGFLREADHVTSSDRRTMSLSTLYALIAADEALKMAAWSPQTEEQRCRTGVAVGTGMADLQDVAQQGGLFAHGSEEQKSAGIPLRKLHPYFIPRILINMGAGRISLKYGFKGPCHSVSTACATGAHAIGDAFRFIRHGDADVMICGGSEAPVNAVSLAGFAKIRALSTTFNDKPKQTSRPFDRRRNGFVMGEGAGVCVLERLDHALSRGAKIYAEVLGYGLSGDAHHITAPHDSGDGAFRAMSAALQEAQLDPSRIGYVNAHATSTPLGDAAESRAVMKLFGAERNVAVSSIKGAVGHLLGAAGAVEGIAAIMACERGMIPPTLNLEEVDEEFASTVDHVANVARAWRTDVRIALNNSFGFGGTNACICVGNYIE